MGSKEKKVAQAIVEEAQTPAAEEVKKEKKAKQKKPWTAKRILKWVLIGVAILLVLTVITNILFQIFTPDDLNRKDQYTASDDAAKKASDRVVATMGDYTLTNGQLQVFYWMQFYEMIESYGSNAEQYLGVDFDKPLYEQEYKRTGLTWEQQILKLTFETWHRYQAAVAEAEKNGYQLPQEQLDKFAQMEAGMLDSAMQQGYESLDAMLQEQFGKAVTFDDYYHYLKVRYTAEYYFAEVISKLEFTDGELNAFYEKNKEDLAKYGITQDDSILVDFRNILVKPVASKDESGNSIFTDEAWANCLEKAQAIWDTWDGSDKTEAIFSGLASIKSEDNNSAAKGGLNQYVPKNAWVTVDVRHILIMPEGGSKVEGSSLITYSAEEWEACQVKAQLLLDEFLAGDKKEETFGEMANLHSEDQGGKVTNGGLYEDVYSGQMVKAFDAWIFDESRKPGDTGLVKTEYGYHIMYFVERKGPVDEWAFDESRKPGDCAMIKTEDGYEIVYYVDHEIAWEVWCREGLLTETSQNLTKGYADEHPIDVDYWAIVLSDRLENAKK